MANSENNRPAPIDLPRLCRLCRGEIRRAAGAERAFYDGFEICVDCEVAVAKVQSPNLRIVR